MQRIKHLLVVLSIGICYLFGQNAGKITGKITDATTGEAIIGANVVIEGTSYGAATNFDGEYVIIKVPSGTYDLRISCMGYIPSIVKNVKVLNDLTTTINSQLSQTTINIKEAVVVVAEAPMIKKDMTSTESRVTSDEIKNLPIQTVDQLISLQAGVSKDAGGGLHIRGGRSTEISYLINGISMTDDFTRSQALTIATESIQELQVISGTFNAEYGNAMSGVVNVITKTGSSKFQSNIELWTGDYVSNNKDIFLGIDKLSPTANYILQSSISGPVFSERLTYFLSLRRTYNGGYLYGINKYRPEGRAKYENGMMISNLGDSSLISMNTSSRCFWQ